MLIRLLLCVAFVAPLAACAAPEEPLPPGPPIAVAYEAACDSTNHQRLVILEGYLNLFPRVLSCYPDEAARTGLSCQVKLVPSIESLTATNEDERVYYTIFIDEGGHAGEARSQGYGFGDPLSVLSADSMKIDLYDRVRLTGRMHARGEIGQPDRLLCTVDADRIEIAARAQVSWTDERQAERDALLARIDSMQAASAARNTN